jgi:hypothetical protein
VGAEDCRSEGQVGSQSHPGVIYPVILRKVPVRMVAWEAVVTGACA